MDSKNIKENNLTKSFGKFGGSFVPETLIPALDELEESFSKYIVDEEFNTELKLLQSNYVGRPTPLYFAENLTNHFDRAKIYLKREDLAHTGAHKINNALGQGLIAKRLGKKRIIAETGAGQHGVATATACALLDLDCVIYMGEEDIKRQAPNVYRIQLLGAEVVPVTSGSRTLKDAVNEAIRDWVTNVENTLYIIGSAVGPHPYPSIVKYFQKIIGDETRYQMINQFAGLPDYVMACVGGGSNAIGIFSSFIQDDSVKLIGVEAAGNGIDSGKHAATMSKGSPGVLHGSYSYLLQDDKGQVNEAHSISAGLDYPGVGPEHSYLKDSGRAEYFSATDKEALEGFDLLSVTEGIIPALEPAHAIGFLDKFMKKTEKDEKLVLLVSGRGDKDLDTVINARN